VHIDNHTTDAVEAVRRAARSGCYDWYLAALLAPRSARIDLLALAAFAGEIGRIPSLVTEPMMGAIRLQWWRDALATDPGARTGHPIADQIRDLAARHRNVSGDLLAIIDAHEVELQPEPPIDERALAIHFDKLWGAQIRVSARALDQDGSGLPAAAAGDAARAYGLARLACELATGMRRAQLLVPPDILTRANCDRDALRDDRNGPPARRVYAELSDAAQTARDVCQTMHLAAVSKRIAPALWPLATVEAYLKAAQARTRPPSELARAWRMLRMWATGRL
jgi:15-cis-phytoene synthase